MENLQENFQRGGIMTDQEFKEFLEKLKVTAKDVDIDDFDWKVEETIPTAKFDEYCVIESKAKKFASLVNGAIKISSFQSNMEMEIYCDDLLLNDHFGKEKELFGEIYNFANNVEILMPAYDRKKLLISFVFGGIFEKIDK